MRDANGRPVPIAQEGVVLGIRGDAELIGVGNGDGDPRSHEADRFVVALAMAGVGGWAMADVRSGTTRLRKSREPMKAFVCCATGDWPDRRLP